MADDLTERIDEVAAGPAAASGDGGSVTQQSLSDLIELEKHRARKDAATKPHRGMRITKLVPPGAV